MKQGKNLQKNKNVWLQVLHNVNKDFPSWVLLGMDFAASIILGWVVSAIIKDF